LVLRELLVLKELRERKGQLEFKVHKDQEDLRVLKELLVLRVLRVFKDK
jgi:hypothetical protein